MPRSVIEEERGIVVFTLVLGKSHFTINENLRREYLSEYEPWVRLVALLKRLTKA